MLHALRRLLGLRRPDPRQLELELAAAAPRDAAELLTRLRGLGLARIARCRLTRNRAVMVSYSGDVLRVHEGYLAAPSEVLRAIVRFVEGRTRAERRSARADVLAFRVPPSGGLEPRRRPRTRAEDEGMAARLAEWHRRYNEQHFGGRLRPVAVRVSRRMRSRLGHYTAAPSADAPPEIAISRAHVRRHGWDEALHTLLHEMVHQWQDEQGHTIDHGACFRAKARELGITPSARRTVAPGRAAGAGRAPQREPVGRRAARTE